MRVTARYQRLINVPMAIDRDAPEVQRLLQSMSITLKVVLLFIFAYIEWAMVNTALGRSSALGKPSFQFLFLLFSFRSAFTCKSSGHIRHKEHRNVPVVQLRGGTLALWSILKKRS